MVELKVWLREKRKDLVIEQLEKENQNLKNEIERLKKHIKHQNKYIEYSEKLKSAFNEKLS